MTGRLRNLGGAQDFSGDPDASLAGANYTLQRSLRDSRIVERTKARGMKLYLGVKLANYYNDATPLKEWFDDAGWSRDVLPKMRDLAAAAELYGFAGIALDQELYPAEGGVATATWAWDYPGNTRSEAQVRAKARQRGAELMGAILDGFPGAELVVYHFDFPGDWNDVVQEEVNDDENVGRGPAAHRLLGRDDERRRLRRDPLLRLDLLQGPAPRQLGQRAHLQRQPGPRDLLAPLFELGLRIRARLHLTVQLDRRGTDHASSFDDARSPEHVAEQLLAFRKWGMGGEFANYAYAPLADFDYSPYVPAMQAGSKPGRVDDVEPTLEVTETAGPTIEGTAHDNLAIRAVRWRDDRGRSGVAG